MGQPEFGAPVSTFREEIRCFLVTPPSGVVIASKNSDREGRSTPVLPVLPAGFEKLAHARSAAITGTPRLRSQRMLPLTASSAYTSSNSVTTMIVGLPPGPLST